MPPTIHDDQETAGRRYPWRKIARWYYILRYHRPSQLIGRGARVVRRRWVGLTGVARLREPREVRLRPGDNLTTIARWRLAQRLQPEAADAAARVASGRYRFLNQERELGDLADWPAMAEQDVPLLWRFHLHYQEYLLDLAAQWEHTHQTEWRDRCWQIMAAWIRGNPPSSVRALRDAWHPFCISRRLPVWITIWLTAGGDPAAQHHVLASMFQQAAYLHRHLERDLGGNHLLENLRALILAGAFFDGREADRWLNRAARLIHRELSSQILPHGEHFERSPMYHAQMLEAVLDVRDATRSLKPEVSEFCALAALRMSEFLQSVLHPDGDIPLWGDSVLSDGYRPEELIRRAETEDAAAAYVSGPTARIIGDDWIFRHGEDYLALDAGPIAPDHLPAHGHADLLSVEASVAGRRLFVDSGVFNYEDDPMRRWCRSTAAHNTVQIDDRDQCDMWSRFRVGYRGWAHGLTAGEQDGFFWARAWHDAYRRLGVPAVWRWAACRPGGPWMIVDRSVGSKSHRICSRLHLHPDFRASKVALDEVEIRGGNLTLSLRSLAPGELRVVSGWYCPQFGKRVAHDVVEWHGRHTLPAVCGWSLCWGDCRGTASLQHGPDNESRVIWNESGKQLQWTPWPVARP